MKDLDQQCKEAQNKSLVRHYIGIDLSNKNCMSYCLTREFQGERDFILSRISDNETEFKEEIENIKKYFNAVEINEK